MWREEKSGCTLNVFQSLGSGVLAQLGKSESDLTDGVDSRSAGLSW